MAGHNQNITKKTKAAKSDIGYDSDFKCSNIKGGPATLMDGQNRREIGDLATQ